MKSGTFKSDISGTFVSDTSGTFGVIYSIREFFYWVRVLRQKITSYLKSNYPNKQKKDQQNQTYAYFWGKSR